ncbi:MAG: hypothetical protein ACHQ50_01540 [Fimbriimonadales bacterium]
MVRSTVWLLLVLFGTAFLSGPRPQDVRWTPLHLAVKRGDLTVENPRSERISLEIRHDVNGEVLAAEGAQITVMGTALNAANKNSRVLWTVTLKPGEKKQFSMTTKTLV